MVVYACDINLPTPERMREMEKALGRSLFRRCTYSRQHLKPSTSSLGNNSAVRKVMTVQDMLTGPFPSCLFE